MYACHAVDTKRVRSAGSATIYRAGVDAKASRELERKEGKGGGGLGLTLVIRLPLHPPLEDLSRSGDVLEKLLEVDKLEPHLVDSRKEGDGSVVEVSGVLDVSSFEFLLKGKKGWRSA